MKWISIFLVIFCLIGFGCEPEESLPHTVASGHVFSTGSGRPLAGVWIYMYDGLPYSNKGSDRRDSIITDSSGYFHIELDGKEPVIFPYKVGYSFSYVVGGATIGIMPLDAGSKNENLEIRLDGEAYFNPILMNKVNFLSEDKVTVYIYSKWDNPSPPSSYLGNGPHIYSWSLPDGITVLGDSYVRYKLEITKSNLMNTVIDSVYIAQGTVYRDTIWY
ncbi:MAG TPA: hypothetical protein PK252_12540 [Bacteroidales bacterium]|nr:hypothetical protein [Bacteroidales bacterium]